MWHSLYFPSFNGDWHSGKSTRFILVCMCVCARACARVLAFMEKRASNHLELQVVVRGLSWVLGTLVGAAMFLPPSCLSSPKMQFFKKCLLLNIQKTEFSDMLSRSLTGSLWKFKYYFLTHKDVKYWWNLHSIIYPTGKNMEENHYFIRFTKWFS